MSFSFYIKFSHNFLYLMHILTASTNIISFIITDLYCHYLKNELESQEHITFP